MRATERILTHPLAHSLVKGGGRGALLCQNCAKARCALSFPESYK